ncbi:MAG: hypothetical protein PHY70_02995 [Methanocellales archaeon]|nr:hypothetical protein [Methanocellales archaeon]
MNVKSGFNVLRNPVALIAAVFIILSMRFYWWQIWFTGAVGKGVGLKVYPHSLVGTIPTEGLDYIPNIGHSLQWFFVVLVIMILMIFIGSFLKKKIGIPLILVSSLMCLAIRYAFRIRLQARIDGLKLGAMIQIPTVPIEGKVMVEGYDVVTNFGLGYDLILVAGIIGILSVILHDRIRINLKRS